jgi:hypothetical protein
LFLRTHKKLTADTSLRFQRPTPALVAAIAVVETVLRLLAVKA